MTASIDTATSRRILPAVDAISFVDLCPSAVDNDESVAPLLILEQPDHPPNRADSAPGLPDDVRRSALAFTRAIVEGITGRRSALQFGDLVAQRVLTVITERARHERNRTPLRPASVRIQLVSGGTAEVTVRTVRDDRSSALAFRLDHRRGAWRCTALVVGP